MNLKLCALALVAVFSNSVAQAEFKVATVDVNRVLNESKDAKVKKKELDEITLKAKAKIEDRRKVLKATEDKLKAASVSPDSKEAEKFRTDAREFARFVKDTDEDIKKEFLKTNKVLTDKALDLIKKYAQQHKIDLVLDKGEKGRGPVLFGDTSADITEDVIKSLN